MNENRKYGLPESDLARVISVLEKTPNISEIILFGSRAKGNYTPGSDVDLALKGTSLGLNDILDVSVEIENLFLPYKFDLIIYSQINEKALLEHIERVGIVLYKHMYNSDDENGISA